MIRSGRPISPSEVAGHYDELDAFYRDIWGEHVHHGLWRTGQETRTEAVHALAELVAVEAGAQPGRRICDIGCGYGATARLLVDKYRAEVTGLTISPAQHRFATSKSETGRSPTYLLEDWLQNSLPDDGFEAAIAIESSEHMPDLSAFFREAWRVLKPGGRLVVCAWLTGDAPTRWQQRHLLEPICREGRMPQMGTASDYQREFEQAGFTLAKKIEISREVAPTWPRIVTTFLGKLLLRPSYLSFLFSREARNRVFAVTILRIWWAYRCGAMRYVVFTGVKQ